MDAETILKFKTLLYHKVDEAQMAEMTRVRVAVLELAAVIDSLPGPSRSKSLAMTHLEDCSMRAIQAIAMEGTPIIPDGLLG